MPKKWTCYTCAVERVCVTVVYLYTSINNVIRIILYEHAVTRVLELLLCCVDVNVNESEGALQRFQT